MSKAPAKGQKTQALYALHWIPTLSPAARRIGAWLVWHANASTGRCDPGQARLREETGLSRRTIQNAVKELLTADIVSRMLRANRSSMYRIHWQKLSDLVTAFEARAKAGDVVVPAQGPRRRGAENYAHEAQETAPTLAQETAPKLSEGNPPQEHVFRDGTISEKSESGALAQEMAQAITEMLHPDDAVGLRLLAYGEDHAFVAAIDRELRSGRLFSRLVADAMYKRLETIHESGEASYGDPVAGRAYRLLETDLYREESA